jgi:hypothetical protein
LRCDLQGTDGRPHLRALLATAARAEDRSAAAAFGRLKTLAGEWEGTAVWIGARTGTYPMNASYSLTGNGSALVENLITEGVPSMTSVYHLDGAALRMTHYCAAQNQPRLKAERIDLAQGAVDFAFVDATSMASADAAHVHGLEMRLVDADHLTLTFIFRSGRGESRERIALKRVERGSPGKG